MATVNYSAKENYYSFLQGAPRAWQLIIPISSNVKRGDTIHVIEVDSGGTPTGNSIDGTVLWVRTNGMFEYDADSWLVHVIPD